MAFNVGSVVAKITADISGFQEGMNKAQSQVEGFRGKLSNLGDNLTSMGKKMTLFVTAPVVGLGVAATKTAADFEQLKVAMTTILGDAGKANQLLDDLKAFASGTPFEFTEIANATKQLLAYGFAQEQIIDTSRMLGDVSAGLNIPFQDLAYLYGTLRAQQVAYTKDMNQFANRGIPIWDELAKVMGKTVPEVRKLVEAGQVDFPIVEQAFKNMTAEGGKFHNLMQAQSGTTAGQFSNLKDSIGFLATDIGMLLLPVANQLISGLRTIVDWLNSLTTSQQQTILMIIAFVAAIGPVLSILGVLSTALSVVIGIVTALGSVVAFVAANPLAWIVIAIGLVVAAGIWLVKHWDDVKEAARKLGQWLSDKWNDIKNMISSIGPKILDAIMWPFNEAKRRIQEAVDWIKDRLDFTQRHSPSVVDIVNRSVDAVNNALGGLTVGSEMSGHVTAVGIGGAGTGNNVNIRIDLAGAFITDEFSAASMGEILGNSMIRKLQQNLRV